MPQFDEKHVKIEGGIVTYDGVSQPEAVTYSDGNKGYKYELSIGVEPHNPDIGLLNNLVQKALQESKWQGQLPAGAHLPVKQASPSVVNAGLGHLTIIKTVTYYAPDVYDEHGQLLDPMQYNSMLYTGQRVDLLVSCKDYDNKSKGVKAQLAGFQIIASANAPRLTIGGDGAAASAFGGQQPAGQPPQGQPAYGQQPAGQPPQGQAPAQAHNFLPQG